MMEGINEIQEIRKRKYNVSLVESINEFATPGSSVCQFIVVAFPI